MKGIELDRATFKRLVWLDIVANVSFIVAVAPQYLTGRWFEFDTAFSALVEERFGPAPSIPDAVYGLSMSAVIIWMIASTVGLFWFKRWARLGFWASKFVAVAVITMLEGFRPTFGSPLDDLVNITAGGTFGAIVLLSYAKDYGADWFGTPAPEIKV